MREKLMDEYDKMRSIETQTIMLLPANVVISLRVVVFAVTEHIMNINIGVQ